MKKEPVVTVGAIVAAVGVLLALGVEFGLPITEAQSDAILTAIPPVAALVFAIIARRMVTPNGSIIEHEVAGKVVAGKGSELATGTVIRDAGSLDTGIEEGES